MVDKNKNGYIYFIVLIIVISVLIGVLIGKSFTNSNVKQEQNVNIGNYSPSHPDTNKK